jgi:rod shape-determining protein MreB and related proteins
MIGERMAEDIKIQIGSALPLEQELSMEVRGRDQVGGLPKTITVRSPEIREALQECLASITGATRSVLEQTPPELASDVIDKGIVMTGGGALLRNIDKLLTLETGVPCYVAENPLACVAIGSGLALERIEVIRRNLPTVEG